MNTLLLVLGITYLHVTMGYTSLKPLSYVQLPTGLNSAGGEVFGGLDLKASEAAAFDHVNSILYVIGSTSHLMHAIDIINPAKPVRLFKHKFTIGEGVPLAIAICGGEIAVALSAQTDTNEGHVRFYRTYTRNSGANDVFLDGYVTVGSRPRDIKYTPDCNIVVVSNEGSAGKDEGGAYVDPEGSVTIIQGEKTGNPSVRLVDFLDFNIGQPNYNMQIRTPSLYIPKSVYSGDTTVAQDLEPEQVTITSDSRTAYVTLRENNAIARVNLRTSEIPSVTALPRKNWQYTGVDVSDRDGGVHRRIFPGLQSLRQPGALASFEIGNKKFLVTADAGGIKEYTAAKHGFAWSDSAIAKTIAAQIEVPGLKVNASNDEYLGRLFISTVDGKNAFTGLYSHLEMFGGRGFSIWDTSNMQAPVFDTEGTLEEYMESFYKPVFNTDYVKATATYTSPEMNRDFASEYQGAHVSSIDVADNNGTVLMVAGTWSTGTLFLYTVDTSSGQPIPQFQAIYRAGNTDEPWADLYTQKTVGDLYISDVGIITSDKSPVDRPLLYVTSSGAGAVSVYEIVDETPNIP
ncbi:mesenchyme-specific cell surface glycoprotein-like [Dreissena polymorpha]|uniref:Choice-of-anchor I domain-containing protein n=1 Tax=Dreissena polymorpha TaxID=45954 RepID=A0A9D4QTJ0_DREPO|nr:mesenchyme-specific cell surface glycoprotein-like [Dreissena polymorpha]KAH3841725.1 hypothetical protein DPMN_115200 [Dreissena polymorpha]